MAVFQWQRQIMFRDCDPAGIVFYPRYFEMMNDCVETFFDQAIGWSFGQMHINDGLGVPMGQISTRFEAPSRLGDVTHWRMWLTRLGGASVDFAMEALGGDASQNETRPERRLRTEGTLVCVDVQAMKSHRWPEAIRTRLAPYLEEGTA
ncbi:acyl-CoA thioesterase [Aestuariibius sp. 2305UL40-4]|uniref:acyl-CoA thioesterase n=1 Tax=Aestuariibius violaceus TaxID=3234132 RepID=UPI00345E1A48